MARYFLVSLSIFVAVYMRGSEAWLTPSRIGKVPTLGSTRESTSSLYLLAANNPDNNESSSSSSYPSSSYLVEVTYEGRSCKVPIRANETLLSGLERNQVPDRLALPELPSECRRGNCLTCVGRHREESHEQALHRDGDGLSPEMSRQTSKLGYILTCSSHVVGEGLKLELGENYKAWESLYSRRLYEESTQYVGRAAMARTIRRSDERNPERWVVETKNALEKSGDEQ